MMRISIVAIVLVLAMAPAVMAQGKDDAVTRAQEDELRAKLQRDDWLIKDMNFRNAKVQDIVAEFRRQVRISIILDAKNIPAKFRVDEFIIHNVPFRTAFNAFLEKAMLVIDSETATLIRISRPPRVTFNFRDADIKAVLDMIARIANANIVISPDVKGTISLNVHDVPWTDVLDAVVKTLNFTIVKERFGIIRIIDPEELKKQMQTEVFKLKYIQPPQSYTANIEEGKFIKGKQPRSPQQAQEVLDNFFLIKMLETVLTRDAGGRQTLGKLNYDPKTNAFVVTDVKPVLDKMRQILDILDVEPAQVIVDVKFISTTNEDLMSFGMNYAFGLDEGVTVRSRPLPPLNLPGITTLDDVIKTAPLTSTFLGKLSRLPFGAGHGGGPRSSQFFLTEYDMVATFRAFKKDKYSRIIQEPTITVLDNEMATIFIGEEIRYAEQQVSVNDFGGTEITLTEARNSPVKVGFQLFILPRIISESNRVLLTIIPVNDRLTGTSSPIIGFERFTLTGVGPNGNDVSIDLPRVGSTTIVTRMLLESGKTAVIGGMVIERATIEDKKIPILGDIPIIGYFFKQSNDVIIKEHLLIFVTPRIVRLDADNDRIQANFRQREEALRRDFEDMRKREAEKKVGEQNDERRKEGKSEFDKMKEGKNPK